MQDFKLLNDNEKRFHKAIFLIFRFGLKYFIIIEKEINPHEITGDICVYLVKSQNRQVYCFLFIARLYNLWSNKGSYLKPYTVIRKVQKRAARLIMNQIHESPSSFRIWKKMTLEKRFEFNHVTILMLLALSYLQAG